MVCTEKVHWKHKTNRVKLVWYLQRRFIGYTGRRNKLVLCLQKRFIGYTGLVMINKFSVYREDSYVTQY